jgi:hypothetical protein
MKKQKMSVTVVLLVLIVGFSFHLLAQEDEVTTTESVRVVNVEVPVRVFFKGSAVDGLTRENFQVFEDGKLQEINGFYIRRKKLAGTGGSLQRTGNLESALGKIEEKEDITYMLTYSPQNPDKIGRIRVKVDDRRFRILYDDQMRTDYINEYLKNKKLEVPDIRILNTNFRNKVLTVDVKDFLMSDQDNHTNKGRVFFEIEILDSDNKILYDKKKTMIADKDHISISVDFPWMKKGRYNLIVQVTDIQTGKTSSDFLQPVIR